MREIRAFECLRKSGLREQCLNRLKREICCPAREIRIPNVYTCVVQSHLVLALEKYVLFGHCPAQRHPAPPWCVCGRAKTPYFSNTCAKSDRTGKQIDVVLEHVWRFGRHIIDFLHTCARKTCILEVRKYIKEREERLNRPRPDTCGPAREIRTFHV